MKSTLPTASELENFYWHCEVAACLITNFPSNAATNSNIAHAVRLATLCCTGKNGIRYATRHAYETKVSTTLSWYKLGLTRGHVIPVNVVVKNVLANVVPTNPPTWDAVIKHLTPADLARWQSPVETAYSAPLAAAIAAQVRNHTLVAWASKKDDEQLRSAGLTAKMPPSYDGSDRFARYTFCGIEVVDLHAIPLATT